MNIFKKVYCRSYQIVLRTLLPILPYRNPKILNSIASIPEVLNKENINRVLIVTDSGIKKAGLLKTLEKSLKKTGTKYFVYDKTVSNPTVSNVEEARLVYLDNNCEGIIAIGGGSTIDCAKAVGARIAKPKKEIPQMRGILKIMKKIPLLIAIPTTAGSGSETTLAAVITDEKTDHKFPINDFPLIPRYAVLDASVTVSLPPGVTATTGMDALTHAMEAYIGRSTTKKTRKDAITAIKLIFNNIERAYNDGTNLKARENMLKAAYLAGAAFTKSYVGYCHSVAHSLGGRYNTPHGLANAVLLPITLDFYGKAVYKKLKKLAVVTGLCKPDASEKDAAEIFIKKIRDLNKSLNIPSKLQGIKTSDIKRLAKKAEKEANPLYPVPKLYTAKELERIYYLVMESEL